MTKPVILITSLLPETGYCGVQTHFRAICAFARCQGYEVRLVDPYQVNRWIRRVPKLIGLILQRLDREQAILWHRLFLFRFLCARLRQDLNELRSASVVIYAQDPLSARAALAMRGEGFTFRLAAVMHFNVSEAFEYVLKGQAREGGALWRSLMRIEREVLPRLDNVLFVSEYMRRIVRARNPALHDIEQTVIPNFPEKIAEATPGDMPMRADIITIGTLEPRKNQGYLLHVLAEAARMGYLYRLTLVGDGPSRLHWEALARQLGIAGQVEFLGYVAGASSLLPAHRVYAHTARMENLPIVLIEAMSNGLPVFAAPVGGISEVFDDGIEGIAWPLDDPPTCAAKLIQVLESQETLARMAKSAKRRYQTNFSPRALGPKWLTAITAERRAISAPRC